MTKRERHTLLRLFEFARPHRRRIVLASIFSVLNKIFDLAPPFLIGAAVDVVVRREDSFLARFGYPEPKDQLVLLATVSFVIWALESIFEYLLDLFWRNLAQRIQHDLRMDAFRHVERLDMRFFEDQSTGGLLSILNDDVNQLERFLDFGANEILQVTTTALTVGAVYVWILPSVAWMALLPVPIIIAGSVIYQRLLTPRYAEVRERVGLLNSQLSNDIGGIATIKSFTAEEREAQRLEAESDAYRLSNRRAIRLSSGFSPLIRFVILPSFVAIMVFAGFEVLDGALEAGIYSVMIYLTQRLLWPLTRLGQVFDLYQRAMASSKRVLDLLDTPPKIVDGPQELSAASVSGELRVEHVDFSYGTDGTAPSEAVPVLRDLDLVFESGKTSAIVGSTGSGKTTLIKLLLRFYDPVSGRVLLDGRDLRDLRLVDLRQAIGLVSQDVYLFHGTVRENILFGRPDATEEELFAAATVAEADGFIRRLPQGYDTVVGERGQKLSGGQRQRISIARAVLKDPPILVFDEATSSVDNETEAAIQRSLARLTVDRTSIVIAHRLSTVRHAHRIFVLDGGELREAGRHEELIERDGPYAALWRVQTGEALATP